MKKSILITLCLLTVAIFTHAQQLSPSVIAADGGIASNGEILIEWTLGEPFVQTLIAPGSLFTEGFHQPTLRVDKINQPDEEKNLNARLSGIQIEISPNPVASTLTIQAKAEAGTELFLRVTDLTGREISKSKLNTPSKESYDMSEFLSGMYIFFLQRP